MAVTPQELSACVELLFAEPPEHRFADRITRAASAGLTAVEMWGWRDKDLVALSVALSRNGVALLSMTVDPMLPIVDPARRREFSGR